MFYLFWTYLYLSLNKKLILSMSGNCEKWNFCQSYNEFHCYLPLSHSFFPPKRRGVEDFGWGLALIQRFRWGVGTDKIRGVSALTPEGGKEN